MPDHHFNPKLAQDHGVDIAIFLNNLYHWVEYNRAYKKNFFEGRYWTFNSIAAFCEVHPYWSKRQIERIIAACKSAGLILSGCFNKDRRDRTAWYTLSDEAMVYFMNETTKVEDCISPNGEMQVTETGHTFPQTVTTIPINKPNRNQLPPKAPRGGRVPTIPLYRPDWFERFWALYPRKTNRVAAVRAWDKLKPDFELCQTMAAALRAQMKMPQWQDGTQHIPHPSTWLNGERWRDEVVTAKSPPQREERIANGLR